MEPKRQKLDLEIVDETNDEACYINALPNEIILKIFSCLTQNQLGQIARVCRKWSMLIKSPVLWRKVDVKFFQSSDSEKDAQSFNSLIDGFPSCVTFIRLDFEKCGDMDLDFSVDFEKLCMKLHQNNPQVKVLILEWFDISTDLPEAINFCTQFLQGLKKLVLHYCFFKDYYGTAELEGNSTIEVLDFNYSQLSYPTRVQFSKLLSLTELRLAQTSVDDAWFLDDDSLWNQLHVVDLRRTCVTASTFRAIQRHGQNLKELYLCDLDLEDNDLNFNVPVFPNLQTICLCGTRVTCEALVSLVQSCPSVVSVDRDLARSFAEHPFVVANRCKSGIVKGIYWDHDHDVDYSPN